MSKLTTDQRLTMLEDKFKRLAMWAEEAVEHWPDCKHRELWYDAQTPCTCPRKKLLAVLRWAVTVG